MRLSSRRWFCDGEGVFPREGSRILEKLNEGFSERFQEEIGRVPSWVIDARRGLPKVDSGEFVVGTCFEDVLACLGDCWDSGFVGAITRWFARNVETFEVGLNVAMSGDCLVKSRSDGSADGFEPLGYFEMGVKNEGGSIKGAGLFYRILVNVFFPPPEWINFVDLGKGVR